MKKFIISVVLTAIFIFFASPVLSISKMDKDTAYVSAALTGWFEAYSPHDEQPKDIMIWRHPPTLKEGWYSGRLSVTTEEGNTGSYMGKASKNMLVNVVNKDGVSLKNIQLLNGKKVAVYAEYRIIEKGEREKIICDKITIIILNEDQY